MKLTTRVVLSLSLALLAASPAAGVNSLDYFETQVPGACLAGNLASRGTYIRQYRETSNQCTGLQVYHIVHGANAHPWSTESFYVKNGYLWQMMELFSSEMSGDITSYRAFRNDWDHWKGIPILKTSFTSSTTWYYPDYVEEYWTDSTGDPVCLNTQQSSVDGTVNWTNVSHVGTWNDWLQDKRQSSLDPNAWHDVDVILRIDQWGTSPYHYEYYYYARWQNPATGQWQGLGLIKWMHYFGSQIQQQGEQHFLADCDVEIECSTCPP